MRLTESQKLSSYLPSRLMLQHSAAQPSLVLEAGGPNAAPKLMHNDKSDVGLLR